MSGIEFNRNGNWLATESCATKLGKNVCGNSEFRNVLHRRFASNRVKLNNKIKFKKLLKNKNWSKK